MTKLEVIRINKAAYANVQNAMNSMNTLERLVAERITLVRFKNNKWLGGMSDTQFDKAVMAINHTAGVTVEAIMNEADRQMDIYC